MIVTTIMIQAPIAYTTIREQHNYSCEKLICSLLLQFPIYIINKKEYVGFCKEEQDSHKYVFFAYKFSFEIQQWIKVTLIGLIYLPRTTVWTRKEDTSKL